MLSNESCSETASAEERMMQHAALPRYAWMSHSGGTVALALWNGHATGLRPMSQSITFIATCPACGRQQLQDGYTRAALSRLLERGRIIEAYCLKCDGLWPISPEERAAMVGALAAEQQGAPASARGSREEIPS